MDSFSDIESSSSDVGAEVNEVETPDADFGDGDGVNDFDDTYESMNSGNETMEYSNENTESPEPVENNNENTDTVVDEQLNDFDDMDETVSSTETPDVAPTGDNVEQSPSDLTTDENADEALSDFDDDGVQDETGDAATDGVQDETGEANVDGEQDETGDTNVDGAQDETGEANAEGTQDETGDTNVDGAQDETGEADAEGVQDETGETTAEGTQDETGDAATDGVQDETGEANVDEAQDETGEAAAEGTQDETGDTNVDGTQDETGDTTAEGTQDETGETNVDGAQDETGDATAEGTQDEIGETNVDGAQDETGDTTAEGTQDETGDANVDGAQDETGEATAEGVQDETGEATTEGPQDETGDTNVDGAQDETGEANVEGPQDETGDTTEDGIQDENGDTATDGVHDETGEATADGTQDETGDTNVEGTKDETGDANTDGEQDEIGETNVDEAQDETGDANTEGTQDETGDTNVDGAQDETGDANVDGTQDETGETNVEVAQDETGEANTEGAQYETGDANVDGAQDETGNKNVDGTDSNSDTERDHTEKNAVFENVSYNQGQNDLGALGTCGPTSIANSLNRVTGSSEYTENKVLHNAMDNNLCHKSDNPYSCGGTTTRDVVNIIDNVKNPEDNIHTEVYEYDKALSVDDLANRLDDPGTVAMVGVDSATLWDQRGDVACSGLFQHTDSPSDHWITVDSPIRDENGNLTGFNVIDSGGGVSEVSREKFEAMYMGDAGHTVSDPTAVLVSNSGEGGNTLATFDNNEKTSNYKGNIETKTGADPPDVAEVHSYSAEEISNEFGTEISQEYIDQNKPLYERYYELKDAGLNSSEIRNQMLTDGLDKYKANHDSDTTPEVLESTMENAYANTLKYDNCVSRDTYMDIKNGLVPYNPSEQFPNAYSIWQDKFVNQDVGALVSDDSHNRIVGNYTGLYEAKNFNAWGRPADVEHPNGDIYVMNYDDAMSVLNDSDSIQDVADTIGIDASWYDTNWTTSEPSDSVWIGKINADEVSGLRTSEPSDLSANEFWAPGMQTANPNGGEGKFEAVINRIEDIKTSHASFSEKLF